MIKINTALKAYRNLIGLSQTKMANKLGICLTSYNQKERGSKEFSHKEMISIMNILKKEIPELTADEIFFTDEVINLKTKTI